MQQEIEKSVLQDIDYILNYQPVVKGVDAQSFLKMTVIKPIAQNVYPQLYTDLIRRFERVEAVQRLKNTGRRVAKYYYSVFPEALKTPQKLIDILKSVAEPHLREKIRLKDVVQENSILKRCVIEVENCFFCSGVNIIENVEIPYCLGLAGLYENLYNIKSLFNKNLEPRLIQVTTMKSATHEKDRCEHELIAVE